MYAICYYRTQQQIVKDKFILFIRISRMNPQGKHTIKPRYFTDNQGLGQNIINIHFFVSVFAYLKQKT